LGWDEKGGLRFSLPKVLFFKIWGMFWPSGVVIFSHCKELFLGWVEDGLTIRKGWGVELDNFYIT
jgi:hypothetical protein